MNPIELTGLAGDTICAISTPQGRGGIAVVRISGQQALDIVQQRWQGKPLADMATHTVHLGQLTDTAGDILDQAVLTVYRAPNSFTGEVPTSFLMISLAIYLSELIFIICGYKYLFLF